MGWESSNAGEHQRGVVPGRGSNSRNLIVIKLTRAISSNTSGAHLWANSAELHASGVECFDEANFIGDGHLGQLFTAERLCLENAI